MCVKSMPRSMRGASDEGDEGEEGGGSTIGGAGRGGPVEQEAGGEGREGAGHRAEGVVQPHQRPARPARPRRQQRPRQRPRQQRPAARGHRLKTKQ